MSPLKRFQKWINEWVENGTSRDIAAVIHDHLNVFVDKFNGLW